MHNENIHAQILPDAFYKLTLCLQKQQSWKLINTTNILWHKLFLTKVHFQKILFIEGYAIVHLLVFKMTQTILLASLQQKNSTVSQFPERQSY